MSQSADDKTTRRRWPPIALCIFPLIIGLTGFSRVAGSAAFESYRTLDVVQLMVSGAGLGVALVAVMLRILRPRF